MRVVALPSLAMGVTTTLLAWSSAVMAGDAASLASQGNDKGAVACRSCHGADGGGQAASGFPRLAGLNAAYLRKQLDDFASGARTNAVMKPIATALSADERKTVADDYAKMSIPAAQPIPTLPMPAADSVGAMLATRGRWSAQLPACDQCHAPGGVGVGEHFPPLAGQPAMYIEAQLTAWKRGTRHNDPLDLMQHVSSALSDGDISAVAAWYAARPLDGTRVTP
jgi:cytochrome c553